MVAILTSELAFPPPETASADGLVAIGGDLSIDRLLVAYQRGIFPWPIFAEDLMTWFSPDPRAVLELDQLHVSRSLARTIRRKTFEVRFNTAFSDVVTQCAAIAPDRPTTWITDELATAYIHLHKAGHAHSVESWKNGKLVGGLYGVAIGGFFAGESMFSRCSDASKTAVVYLVERLRDKGFVLLDIQQATSHMLSLGAEEVPRAVYLKRLERAIALDRQFI
ncbi:MAG: leucyl/phenylalanyl-tRNA--protein transferase [Myxococcales bacterium]|nr:leucyl/phenylalanyl-tRNA--protein transferase [Myxococcales bacterium]